MPKKLCICPARAARNQPIEVLEPTKPTASDILWDQLMKDIEAEFDKWAQAESAFLMNEIRKIKSA